PRALVSLPDFGLEAEGPLLITHWGMSGPAILKLSSWGARDMAERNYRVPLLVNWNPAWSMEDLRQLARTETKRQVKNTMQLPVPRRLWMGLLKDFSGLQKNWSEVSDKELSDLYQRITKTRWPVHGKSTFKEEFVTAGGVELKEIDFKSFQSRRIPRLYLAGEVLNIDALTGGFNFQAAWTGSYIAGQAMAALGIDMD
ncbi:MAG: NAD(P)/FAD-dependent oxidoreductase, partial [Saprospiraceae bacterium]|nr:NAD(P)/FAD-dependent oxidoreductase [Saprospiraceae bacterium]